LLGLTHSLLFLQAIPKVGVGIYTVFVMLGNAMSISILTYAMAPTVTPKFHAWGALGAFLITMTAFFGAQAISTLGAAAAPGVWCVVGIITSVSWGVFVFDEKFNHPMACGFAVVALIVGPAAPPTPQPYSTTLTLAETVTVILWQVCLAYRHHSRAIHCQHGINPGEGVIK